MLRCDGSFVHEGRADFFFAITERIRGRQALDLLDDGEDVIAREALGSPVAALHTRACDTIVAAIRDTESAARADFSVLDATLLHLHSLLPHEAEAIAMHAAAAEGVCWVEPVYAAQSVNAWSSRSRQRGAGGVDAQASAQVGVVEGCDARTCTPFWEAGIMGAGQVIGFSDTGLNTRSCSFADKRAYKGRISQRPDPRP